MCTVESNIDFHEYMIIPQYLKMVKIKSIVFIIHTWIEGGSHIKPGNRTNLIVPITVFWFHTTCFFWSKVLYDILSSFKKWIIFQKSTTVGHGAFQCTQSIDWPMESIATFLEKKMHYTFYYISSAIVLFFFYIVTYNALSYYVPHFCLQPSKRSIVHGWFCQAYL